MAPVVVRLRQWPAPHSRQISTWGEKKRENKNAPFFFICLLSLSTRRRHCGRFLGRLGPAGRRGPNEAHVGGQVQRYATAQPLSDQGEKGPGDIVSTMSSSSRTATKLQRHLASAILLSCWGLEYKY